MGYVQWGTHPLYARLTDGAWIPGRFYYKILIGEAAAPREKKPGK
jgi:hypothetical protein